MQKVEIKLFDKHIATMFEDDGRIYLEQLDAGAHLASPLSIQKDIKQIETTTITATDGLAGFIHDALPGDYGNDIMDKFFENKKRAVPTVSDRLLFIGDRALGALSFEPVEQHDEIDEVLDMRTLFEQSKTLQEGRITASIDHFMVAAHSIAGGARSKALVGVNLESKEIYIGHKHADIPDNFIRALVKYDETEQQRHSVYTKMEYIYSQLATASGVEMARCELMETDGRFHFVTERFDHVGDDRFHMHSLAGLLQADYRVPRSLDYDNLFTAATALNTKQSHRQLFLQMLFNYMFVNQDDHSKNFSFMMDKNGTWKTTPAYDLTYANGAKNTTEHQLLLSGKHMSTASLEDFLALADRHDLSLDKVVEDIEKMANVRETLLPRLMKEFEIEQRKQDIILTNTTNRTFQGAL